VHRPIAQKLGSFGYHIVNDQLCKIFLHLAIVSEENFLLVVKTLFDHETQLGVLLTSISSCYSSISTSSITRCLVRRILAFLAFLALQGRAFLIGMTKHPMIGVVFLLISN
jgi:hypothetical protein